MHYVSKCGSENNVRYLPKLAQRLFCLNLIGFSDTAEVNILSFSGNLPNISKSKTAFFYLLYRICSIFSGA